MTNQHHRGRLQCDLRCKYDDGLIIYDVSSVSLYSKQVLLLCQSPETSPHSLLLTLHIPYCTTFMTSFPVMSKRKSTRGKEDGCHYIGRVVSFDLEEIGSALMESFSGSSPASKEGETKAGK